MSTKILASLSLIALASAGLGYGTYAAFSSEASSANNLFTAGTIELSLGGATDVNAFVGSANFAPGDVVNGTLVLVNEGSIFTGDGEGHQLKLNITAQNSHANLSRFLNITSLTYDGEPLSLPDSNGNGHPDLADFDAGAWIEVADPRAFNDQDGKSLFIEVKFSENAGNDLQGALNTLKFTFTLSQL